MECDLSSCMFSSLIYLCCGSIFGPAPFWLTVSVPIGVASGIVEPDGADTEASSRVGYSETEAGAVASASVARSQRLWAGSEHGR